jgi:hypothetical protein
MYDNNVLGTMRMTRARLPKLVASGDGLVLTIGRSRHLSPIHPRDQARVWLVHRDQPGRRKALGCVQLSRARVTTVTSSLPSP